MKNKTELGIGSLFWAVALLLTCIASVNAGERDLESYLQSPQKTADEIAATLEGSRFVKDRAASAEFEKSIRYAISVNLENRDLTLNRALTDFAASASDESIAAYKPTLEVLAKLRNDAIRSQAESLLLRSTLKPVPIKPPVELIMNLKTAYGTCPSPGTLQERIDALAKERQSLADSVEGKLKEKYQKTLADAGLFSSKDPSGYQPQNPTPYPPGIPYGHGQFSPSGNYAQGGLGGAALGTQGVYGAPVFVNDPTMPYPGSMRQLSVAPNLMMLGGVPINGAVSSSPQDEFVQSLKDKDPELYQNILRLREPDTESPALLNCLMQSSTLADETVKAIETGDTNQLSNAIQEFPKIGAAANAAKTR